MKKKIELTDKEIKLLINYLKSDLDWFEQSYWEELTSRKKTDVKALYLKFKKILEQ